MQRISILALFFAWSSLLLLSLGAVKASPLPDAPCGPNSHYEYGTVCPESCDNLYYIQNTMCIELAVLGCFCDQGYVLESDSSKNCVPKESCPISCPENMHYQTGASTCQATCFEPSGWENCDDTWRYNGCVCNDGYIISYRYPYDASNVCVRPSECKTN